jgi:acyl-CoA thioester hydrolase
MVAMSAPEAGEHRPALVTARVNIRWVDEDGYGHVNNAVYLNYLEEARDRVVDSLFEDSAIDFVIAHVGIDYLAEVTHRDGTVEVDSWVTGHGTSSVRTAEVIRKLDGTVAARARTVLVPRAACAAGSRALTPQEVQALLRVGSTGPAL